MRDWIAPSAGRPSVSLIYNKIIDCITKTLSIKTIWNRELSDLNLSVDWERVWSNLSLTSKNLAHRLIHFKVIHRAYITPYKRFKMKLQSNLNCHICNTTSSGTFLHMFWECPVVISLWTHVNLVLSSLLRIDWSVNPSLCLLNDDSGLCISSMQKRMLFAGFTAVKKTIIQNWFTPHMCREAYWIRSLLQIVSCECTTARVGGARPSTIEAWQCFLLNIRDYVKEWFLCSCCPSLSPSLLIEPWDVEYVSAVLFCFILDIMLCCVWKNKIKIVDNKKYIHGKTVKTLTCVFNCLMLCRLVLWLVVSLILLLSYSLSCVIHRWAIQSVQIMGSENEINWTSGYIVRYGAFFSPRLYPKPPPTKQTYTSTW